MPCSELREGGMFLGCFAVFWASKNEGMKTQKQHFKKKGKKKTEILLKKSKSYKNKLGKTDVSKSKIACRVEVMETNYHCTTHCCN